MQCKVSDHGDSLNVIVISKFIFYNRSYLQFYIQFYGLVCIEIYKFIFYVRSLSEPTCRVWDTRVGSDKSAIDGSQLVIYPNQLAERVSDPASWFGIKLPNWNTMFCLRREGS